MSLLVDGQHHRVAGGIHIEANDILDLGGEGGIMRTLERADPIGLQTMLLPDPLHGAQ